MTPDVVKRYSAPVPRYTSYPTAPHFNPAVGADQYEAWLASLAPDARLSLYLHIPFCASLCWYCGCSTKAVRRYEPVADYLTYLNQEIGNVAQRIRARSVSHVHWGGGTPNILEPADILVLAETTRRNFQIGDGAEVAVEIDPRGLDEGRIAAFARAGINRISLGVQDFDPKVQAAINREQSFETTRAAVEGFRAHGIDRFNIDLVYGLPHQTRDSVEDTIGRVLELGPSRIALFGYAHLPERIKHQQLILSSTLPDALERFAQANRVAHVLVAAGYQRVGLDHFARADDPLCSRNVSRNFQGYTTDAADALIGFGATSIGHLPQGYVQNAVPVADYQRRIAERGLATVRGFELSDADRMRALVIERLMCDLSFPAEELRRRFGTAAEPVLKEAEDLIESDGDNLVERDGETFRVTERGRPFVRSIAACFDSYLETGRARHSAGV
jgi:oxygen-independent coproporphyrinogen-3 oxidase